MTFLILNQSKNCDIPHDGLCQKVGRGHGDSGTSGLGDAATPFQSIEFQKWENIPKEVELLMLICKNDQLYAFQVPTKYTAKFKN